MTAVFLAVSTTAASILMPATGIYAAETAAATQNTQAAQTTQNSQNTQTTKNTQEYDWPQAPDIVAQSAILIDADTGAILYEKDAHAKGYPASTTKILTGLLTIENCGLDETVTFSSAAANSVTYEDASLGTKAGEQYSVEQALYGLLLYSANEIAYGLAEHVSGSLAAFTELMNKRAKELGAINTHFANASGLHDVNHYTTAYDMAMIAKGCYNNSTFVNIDSTSTTYTIPPTNKTDTARNFKHRHLMLKGRQYYYEYCKGGKTGFTEETAKAAGFDPASVTVVTDDKAHYYPGSDTFIIKVVADKATKKFLGVEALGAGAVDKVVDVGATALALKGSLDDLDNMDMAYAPPFSTAIHPFVLAVQVLENKLDGTMDSITPEEYATGDYSEYKVIDASITPAIEGAPFVDPTTVEGVMPEFSTDDKLLLVCTKGKRAYLLQNKLRYYGYTNTKVLESGTTFNGTDLV